MTSLSVHRRRPLCEPVEVVTFLSKNCSQNFALGVGAHRSPEAHL